MENSRELIYRHNELYSKCLNMFFFHYLTCWALSFNNFTCLLLFASLPHCVPTTHCHLNSLCLTLLRFIDNKHCCKIIFLINQHKCVPSVFNLLVNLSYEESNCLICIVLRVGLDAAPC